MSLKDYLIVLVISLGCFPIVLGIVLFATGYAGISLGWDKDKDKAAVTQEAVEYTPEQESLAALHSKSFKALEAQRHELEAKERMITEDESRLNDMRQEISRKADDLNKTKKQIEELVDKSATMEERKVRQLADTYGAMRPEEAAPILSTLTDALIVRILENIDDERKRGKMLAALGNISKERAGTISKLMSELAAKKPKGGRK